MVPLYKNVILGLSCSLQCYCDVCNFIFGCFLDQRIMGTPVQDLKPLILMVVGFKLLYCRYAT